MGDRGDGWITVGHRHLGLSHGQPWAELEAMEREAIAAWDHDEQWPSV